MSYQETRFSLTNGQLKKITKGVHDNEEFTLRLSKVNNNVQGYSLPLTSTQIKKLDDGNVHDIKFSLSQVNYITNKVRKHSDIKKGGFLPLIPIIAGVLAAGASVAGTVASRVQQAKADKEMERHNREMEKENSGIGLKNKKGEGLRQKEKSGSGLKTKKGKGLRL